ncbi:MAG: ATP-binding cassette domain-containing protein [Lachnospiraceae bacterium]|nr:ATP-binding cassette domain-containing protein [Lachnospiraceae bacterium]
MGIINVKNLRKIYTTYKRSEKGFFASFFKRKKIEVRAVDGIDFEIEKGTIVGMLGPNGAGKSTTIKMLCGALFPTEGEIEIMGYSPAKDRAKYVKRIGAVFGQKSQLIFDIPPADSFAMNKAIYGIPDDVYEARLREMVELFGIKDVIHKPTRVLSLGERMKCEIVMAMLHDPEVVFLDEPTIGLDVIAKATIRDTIKKMNQKGVTFILTTHDLGDVEELAERVIVINHGKKIFDDSLKKLKLLLGNKKIVDVSLAVPFEGDSLDGMSVNKNDDGTKISVELDLDKTEVKEFLTVLGQATDFTDIEIRELPMEEIITRLYTE